MGLMIQQDEAVEALGDERLAILTRCINAAWEQFERHFRPILPLCSPTGMANTLRELVIQQVREKYVGLPGVTIHDHNVVGGRFLVEIDGRMLLSFKKLTRDFLTTNNPTDTSRAFDRQEPGIEGMPDLPRITVGYQLGQFGTTLSGVYLAFVVGEECVWHHDLLNETGSIEIEFPREGESAAEQERKAAEREEARRRAAKRRKSANSENNSPRSAEGDADGPEVTNGG